MATLKEKQDRREIERKEEDDRTIQNRRAAPVSKVFTILAKNKVQRPDSPSRPGITGNKNQNHRPCIPRPPLAWLGLDLLRLGKRQVIYFYLRREFTTNGKNTRSMNR